VNRRRKPQRSQLVKPEDRIVGVSRVLVVGSAKASEPAAKAKGSGLSVSGGVMDGGGWILIDGSTGDARSGRNRKFIAGQDREDRAGESRSRIN
jgi:hypothetical protein